jgi:Putative transposase/Transposase zinc-binding domain
MLEVADVLRRYGREYLDRFEQDLLPSHRRAIADLLACRTEVLGGQLWPCDHCGQEHDVYHSCRNRSCPTCHRLDTEAWLEDRRRELLPVPYFHIVFTLPQELRELVRRHQNDLYDILLRAAAQALITLAADPQYVGGRIGVLCVLHTWSRTLAYHPHVHCLVPAGGVSADHTEWRPARPTYLVPVQALAKLFRGLFRELVHQERPDLTLAESVWTKGWVVYCKPTMQGAEPVLQYLGRYIHRIALTNSRILSIEDGHVCFRYQDGQDQRWKTMTLPALEFIRRFLPHVLPQGFHKVRYYGLWSPVHRPLLHQLQLWLASQHPPAPLESPDRESQSSDSAYAPLQAGQLCLHCGQGWLVLIRRLPRCERGPP